jgi:hypothetical protein
MESSGPVKVRNGIALPLPEYYTAIVHYSVVAVFYSPLTQQKYGPVSLTTVETFSHVYQPVLERGHTK